MDSSEGGRSFYIEAGRGANDSEPHFSQYPNVESESAVYRFPEREDSTSEQTEPLTRRPNRWRLKAAIATSDLSSIMLAMLVAAEIRLKLPAGSRTGLRLELEVALLSLPIWFGLLARNRLYTSRHVASIHEECRRLGSTVIAGCLGLAATSFLLHKEIARGWILGVAPIAFVFLAVERGTVRTLFARARVRGRLVRPVVIVGANREGRSLAEALSSQPSLGYKVLGFVDDDPIVAREKQVSILSGSEDIVETMRSIGATGAFIAMTALDGDRINWLTRVLVRNNFHVELSSSLKDIYHGRLSIRPLGPFPVMSLEPTIHGGWRAAAKRTLDIVLASVALILSIPVLFAVALVVKVDSAGPILFRQTRVGRHGEPFELLKIRTMVVGAESRLPALLEVNEASGPLFKLRNDPRVTRCGRFLRSWSLDEIPQLWNVLKGDMSLVGPRPALAREVTEWSPQLHERLQVRPGITGMWQLKGRGGANFDDYLRLDLFYVENWSLLADLSILVKTVPAVLRRTGAW